VTRVGRCSVFFSVSHLKPPGMILVHQRSLYQIGVAAKYNDDDEHNDPEAVCLLYNNKPLLQQLDNWT
jgi:hypothetical protein